MEDNLLRNLRSTYLNQDHPDNNIPDLSQTWKNLSIEAVEAGYASPIEEAILLLKYIHPDLRDIYLKMLNSKADTASKKLMIELMSANDLEHLTKVIRQTDVVPLVKALEKIKSSSDYSPETQIIDEVLAKEKPEILSSLKVYSFK